MRLEDDGIPYEWVDFKQLIRYLKLSEPTGRRLLKARKLPGAVKIGKLWRFHRPTLDAELLKRREG